MMVGFTGTRQPLPEAQRLALAMLIRILFGKSYRRFCMGCCVGADACAARLAKETKFFLIGRPGHIAALTDQPALALCDELHPAEDNMARNEKIVADCSVLVGCPSAPEDAAESRRSGTWATIRRGLKAKRPIALVWPDGNLTTEGEW